MSRDETTALQTASPQRAGATLAPAQRGSRFVDEYLAFLLAQASSRISHAFHREVKAAGISVRQWRVLASLEGSDGETIGALSQLTLTKQPTLSKIVLRMETDGLVSRTRVRADMRQTIVKITAAGHQLTEALRKQAWQHQAAVLQPFEPQEAELLIVLLKRLLRSSPAVDSSHLDE